MRSARSTRGVAADELVVPSGIDEDEMIVRVASGVDPAGPFDVKVRASNGVKTKETTFALTVEAP